MTLRYFPVTLAGGDFSWLFAFNIGDYPVVWELFHRPLELYTLQGRRKHIPPNGKLGKSSSSTVPAMGSVICDRSQQGNVKFTSKMERLPILREDDKVVWNWWCIV